MKIVFVNRFYAPDTSATAQMLTDLAVELASDMDVHIVTSRLRYRSAAANFAPRGVIDGVVVHRVWTTAFGRAGSIGRLADYLSFYVTSTLLLLRMVRARDIVVAETDPPLVSVPVYWVTRFHGARLVNWLQDLFPEVAAELGVAAARGPIGRLLRRLRNVSLRHAAANVVLGERMRRRVAVLGIAPAKLEVIPNWADGLALQAIAPAANPLRAEWMLDGKFVVGYSGNMGRAHEFDTLLGAAAALRDQDDIVFVFIGDGAQRSRVGELALRDGSRVVFKPYQPRELLKQSLCVADLHIVTLRPEMEGLIVPSKFYGAAAVGRATIFIGDPEGEIGSIVRETECGLCVEQGNVEGLVSAITALKNNRALLERMGRNARRVLEERFDRAIAAQAWFALFRSLEIGGAAQRPR